MTKIWLNCSPKPTRQKTEPLASLRAQSTLVICMLELARRKSSTGKLYRRVKKDPYGAGQRDSTVVACSPTSPTYHFREAPART
jgi:hypothetical protein